jgi:hypothetical protein
MEDFKRILLRAINRNQILILSSVRINNGKKSISSILREISRGKNIPPSTLKLNSKILKQLGLIDFGDKINFKPAKLTPVGKFVISIIENGKVEEGNRNEG